MRNPWQTYTGCRLCARLGHKPARPFIHEGNELLVDELVRYGDPAGRLEPEGYIYFGCPRCRVNLIGLGGEQDRGQSIAAPDDAKPEDTVTESSSLR